MKKETINYILGRKSDDASVFAIRSAINAALESDKNILFLIRDGVDKQRALVHKALRLKDKIGNFDPRAEGKINSIVSGIKFIITNESRISPSSISQLAKEKGIEELSDYILLIDDVSNERLPSPSTVFGMNLLQKREGVTVYYHKTTTESITAHEISHLKQCTLVERKGDGVDIDSDLFGTISINF